MFSGGRGRTEFSAGMGLFPEWAQEMYPPHQLGAEKSQVEIAKIISIVCFSSQRASKSEQIELEVKSPAETNLGFSISPSEPWLRALIEDDFLIKLGGAELAGVQMRLFAGTGEQNGGMGKNLLKVKGGKSKRARVKIGRAHV